MARSGSFLMVTVSPVEEPRQPRSARPEDRRRPIGTLAPAKQLEVRVHAINAGADRIDGRDDRRKPITPIDPAREMSSMR